MAKTGQIQLDGISVGTEPLADSVVFTESTPSNLGGVVADLIDKSDAALKVLVNLTDRTVKAFPVATADAVIVVGDDKLDICAITRDDPTKRTGSVVIGAGDTLTGHADELAFNLAISTALATAVKPSKNVASIVAGVEDVLAAMAKQDPPVTFANVAILIDQTDDGVVKVFTGFDSIGTTGAVAKLKQVIQADAGATAPLAFE